MNICYCLVVKSKQISFLFQKHGFNDYMKVFGNANTDRTLLQQIVNIRQNFLTLRDIW